MKINPKAVDTRFGKTQLAGGYGMLAANQDAEAQLRRAVMANLLWEDNFYQDGQTTAETIIALIPQVEPMAVMKIAIEARQVQKLRHVPLLITREMARYPQMRKLLGTYLPQVIQRPDELTEFLAIYWKDGKVPLANQVKKGLAASFANFNAYQLAKYNRDEQIKLRDVMFLVHPGEGKNTRKQRKQGVYDETPYGQLLRQLAENTLPVPDTWEVNLSTGKDKKETWERLIADHKLGALAFLRNLRNMREVGVSETSLNYAFKHIPTRWLLPLNYWAAAKAVPYLSERIEQMMLRGFAQAPKLPGTTVFIADVSGSMQAGMSDKSEMRRLDIVGAMAAIARELSESCRVFVTAGDDSARKHKTKEVAAYRGFALSDKITHSLHEMGGGGIFTRQALEYVKGQVPEADRILVFSDSQDCDYPEKQTPAPFGKHNYIIDVAAHTHGINYRGVWDAEISGWSEHFIDFILAYEGLTLPAQEED